MFPDINDCIANRPLLQGYQQRIVVNNATSTGIYDIRYAREMMEECFISHVPCSISAITCQWYMERDDIRLTSNLLQTYKVSMS